MSIPTLIRSYPCSADVAAFRIVKFSDVGASSSIAAAAAATDPLWGISDAMGGKQGGMADIIVDGFAEVQLGGGVSAGQPLTSDADGKAIGLVGSAGATRRLIAFAEQPGVSGDIIQVKIARGLLQLP